MNWEAVATSGGQEAGFVFTGVFWNMKVDYHH